MDASRTTSLNRVDEAEVVRGRPGAVAADLPRPTQLPGLLWTAVAGGLGAVLERAAVAASGTLRLERATSADARA